jgi:plasmid stabilization system protein ParE
MKPVVYILLDRYKDSRRRYGLTPYPYIIDYRVAGDDLIVMRLRHTARRPVE